jgi:hypothetical protein
MNVAFDLAILYGIASGGIFHQTPRSQYTYSISVLLQCNCM